MIHDMKELERFGMSSKNKIQFSESMVQKMSDKEFEKNEEAITASIQSGNFAYDISGAAR